MTPGQYAAGWRDAGSPDAGPPACVGSGQATIFAHPRAEAGAFSAAWDTCPECGRRVQIVTRDGLAVLATHQPPQPSQGGSPRRIDGPTLFDL